MKCLLFGFFSIEQKIESLCEEVLRPCGKYLQSHNVDDGAMMLGLVVDGYLSVGLMANTASQNGEDSKATHQRVYIARVMYLLRKIVMIILNKINRIEIYLIGFQEDSSI